MNTGNVGQNAVDQEIRASKGTAGGDFGLIFAMVRGVWRDPPPVDDGRAPMATFVVLAK